LLHPEFLAAGRRVAVIRIRQFLEAVLAGVVAYYVCKWLDALLSLME
jgi:hypothetical protein